MATIRPPGDSARSEPPLTIVVPFWNVRSGGILSSTIRDSLRSRAGEVSVIIVDDHSDASSANAVSNALSDLCNVHMVKSPRNCGPGGARNAGLDLVETDWVVFADADDDMDVDAYLELVQVGSDEHVDVVAGSYRVNLINNVSQSRAGLIDRPSNSLAGSLFRRAAVWRFAFRTKSLREKALHFPLLRYAEDLVFLLELAGTRPRYRAVESATVTSYTAPRTPPTPSEAEFRDVIEHLSILYRNTSDLETRRVINAWRVRITGYQIAYTSAVSGSRRNALLRLAPSSPGELAELARAFGRVTFDLVRNPPVLLRNRTSR